MKNKKSINNAKKNIVNKINNSAVIYKNNLVGKTFLLLYDGKNIEVSFKDENFLHLCGVETNLYAKDFYKKAVKRTLGYKDIYFTNVHPYKLADKKTNFLSQAFLLLKNESLVVTDVKTQSKNYKIGTTDCNILLCFDKIAQNQNIFIPYSLRVKNINANKFKNIYEVDYVLSKKNNEKQYNFLEYGDESKLEDYLIKYNIKNNININKIIGIDNYDIDQEEDDYER